jgi:hypothetical protein
MKSNSNKLNDWDEVDQYIDKTLSIPASYFCKSNDAKYPRLAFTAGQIASKAWLLKELYPILTHPVKNCAIIGSWIGTLVPLLHRKFIIDRIYGIDCDKQSVDLSEEFNHQYVQDGWKYKGVVMDIQYQFTNWLQFETGGELIQVKPDLVINTSCEHMNTDWFDSADSDQLIVMQTNNYHDWHEHTNTLNSIQEMQNMYKLSKTLYAGSLELPVYTRFMQIGFK